MSDEILDSYKAIVVAIRVRKHPNADRLQIGRCVGVDVIVGSDVVDGQLGVFFDIDGQLSEEFVTTHDLIARRDSNGRRAGGFFSSNRRVRCQTLRGIKSSGFWMPLSCLDYTGVDRSTLVEGFEFSELNGHPICNKYFTPSTRAAQQHNRVKENKPAHDLAGDVRKILSFPKHLAKTQFLYRSLGQIPKGALIHVTEKGHGCVDKDTLIDTLELGIITMGKAHELKLESLHVKSLDLETNQVVYSKVSDYYYLPYNGNWYEIELESGEKITITSNNPVWLPELNIYREVENLKVGDSVLLDTN